MIYECIKDLPRLSSEKEYLKEIDSMSLRCTLFDLDNAYNKFFKEKIGFPKYKSKFDKNTYRTNYIKNTYKGKIYENIKLDLINKTLTLPKLKEIKIRGYRNLNHINGRIINVTVIKEKDNTYYASVLVEEEIVESIIIPTKIIGLDLGIKDIVITSSFEKYNNEKLVLKYNPKWSGAGEVVHPIIIPECYKEKFELVYHGEFPLKVHFTAESWHGRMKACRGVGASLSEKEINAWEQEHLKLLSEIAPKEFDIQHYGAIAELKKK